MPGVVGIVPGAALEQLPVIVPGVLLIAGAVFFSCSFIRDAKGH